MVELNLADLREIALALNSDEIIEHLDEDVIELALLIRAVELALLEEFQKGNIPGTIHTCVGQELSPALISKFLTEKDYITSNHRCHGHFIAKTNNWKGLVLELLGSRNGVCRGVGSSQHLYMDGFISNGPQGSLLPVGTGISHWMKSKQTAGIVISFIGEGTLGEGITYESLNLAAITSTPQLFVCENNFYSQSTKQEESIAGQILSKPKSFGMEVFCCNIWEPQKMQAVIKESLEYVRLKGKPAFLLIQCYRLMAHSKGDDNRELKEINLFYSLDPITKLIENFEKYRLRFEKLLQEVKQFILNHNNEYGLTFEDYAINNFPSKYQKMIPWDAKVKIRTVEAIRNSISRQVEDGAFLVGEDIRDPYGGAFKATRGISTNFPNSVMNSPISEAALVGFSLGKAVMGQPVIVEIMFADFVTYAFDQIVNNASKFFHVYGISTGVPILIRMPSGGHRGYGPTHSQSLEKHLLGLDNVLVIAITSLVHPELQLSMAIELKVPTIVIENKIGYSKMIFQNEDSLLIRRDSGGLGILVANAKNNTPHVTIISYGELARELVDHMLLLEEEFNICIEIICLLQLHPIPLNSILERKIGKLVIVAEEGSKSFGLGAEIGTLLLEEGSKPQIYRRIAAEPYPIASNRDLEEVLLANLSKVRAVIVSEINNVR